MPPNFSSNDLVDVSGASEELPPESVLRNARFMFLPDLKNLSSGKPTHAVLLPHQINAYSPPLRVHLLNVFKLGAKSQVGGVAALRIVALVQHVLASRNRRVGGKDEGHSVSQTDANLSIKASAVNLAIAHVVERLGPQPALILNPNSDIGQKAILKSYGEQLCKKCFGYSLRMHKSVRLICATLSATLMARGHFYATP